MFGRLAFFCGLELRDILKLLAVGGVYLMFFIFVQWLIIRAIALFNLIEVRAVMRDDDLCITIRVDEVFEVGGALIFRL